MAEEQNPLLLCKQLLMDLSALPDAGERFGCDIRDRTFFESCSLERVESA